MNALDTSLLRTSQLRHKSAEAPSPAQLAARVARYKSNFLNRLIRLNEVESLIQFGCADGRLSQRLKVGFYTGVDSGHALLSLDRRFTLGGARRDFFTPETLPADAEADLTLSLDLINRLAGDGEFNAYLRTLFGAARHYVVIHGSGSRPTWSGEAWSGEAWSGEPPARPFTTHVARYFPAWRLAAHVPSPFPQTAESHAQGGDFFVYARAGAGCAIPVLALI